MSKHRAAPKGPELASNKIISYHEEVEELNETRVRNLDELAMQEELFSGVLLGIRKDIKEGLSAEDILQKYAHIAAARVVTVALTDADSGKALAASKDILDRHLGKAREKKEITHKLDKVDEKQLDAILLTELAALEVDYEDVSNSSEDASDEE